MSTVKKVNADKTTIIDDLKAKVDASPFVLVIDYTGVTVPEFTTLRADLAAAGASCVVAKNTFMAKAINNFAKKSKKAAYKAGILDGAELSPEKIKALGDLPSREVLLATLLCTINGAGSALARVIQAYVDKENGGAEQENASAE